MTVDIQKMRTLLFDKHEELLHRIAGFTEAHSPVIGPEDANQRPRDFEEIAADDLERQQEQLLLLNEQSLLQEVEDALKRIEGGIYGRCIVCGQPIPDKRLEAIPWAARCIKDEEQAEQGNLKGT
jgi:DnaK suppressor protein